jgi:hypothetical protein
VTRPSDDFVKNLAEADVLTVDGESQKLGRYFEDKAAALLFVRHFG